MNLILLGGPGSGKGTQAEALKLRFGLLHLSSGQLFRRHIREQSELGKQAEAVINQGNLVPDEITVAMLRERLQASDARAGAILDGFPRTLAQAKALNGLMEELGRQLAGVISIEVADEEIVRRLSGRLVCRECDTAFHQIFSPFTACPFEKCQGEHLYRREDDEPETIRERLQVFHRLTEPLIEYYEQTGLLTPVDGQGTIEQVTRRVLEAAEAFRLSA